MSMNGKRDAFTMEDFTSIALVAAMKRGREKSILREVVDAVSTWESIAAEVSIEKSQSNRIANGFRLDILPQ